MRAQNTPTQRAGILKNLSGDKVVELWLGGLSPLGPLKLLTHWQPRSGLLVLVLVPLQAAGMLLRKSGRRQAGAFLLRPGESFNFSQSQGAEERFRLEAEAVIRISAGPDALCDFCRSPFAAGSDALALLIPDSGLGGQLLCRACAACWREQTTYPLPG